MCTAEETFPQSQLKNMLTRVQSTNDANSATLESEQHPAESEKLLDLQTSQSCDKRLLARVVQTEMPRKPLPTVERPAPKPFMRIQRTQSSPNPSFHDGSDVRPSSGTASVDESVDGLIDDLLQVAEAYENPTDKSGSARRQSNNLSTFLNEA